MLYNADKVQTICNIVVTHIKQKTLFERSLIFNKDKCKQPRRSIQKHKRIFKGCKSKEADI